MLFKVGDIIRYYGEGNNPTQLVSQITEIIGDMYKIVDVEGKTIGNINKFTTHYVDKVHKLDKEYIWNKEFKELLDEETKS